MSLGKNKKFVSSFGSTADIKTGSVAKEKGIKIELDLIRMSQGVTSSGHDRKIQNTSAK